MRLLWHAIDGLGLGHVVRLLAIAGRVGALRPGWQSLFLTNSDADSLIVGEGFPVFKVPSRTSFAAAGFTGGRQLRLVQSATQAIVSTFDPHALITDTMPAGPYLELLPILQWPVFKAFVYRERRDEAARAPDFQEILRAYHLLLVPHTRGSVELVVPPGPRVAWCGDVLLRTRREALGRREARRHLGLPEVGAACLVSAGGAGGGPETGRAIASALEAAASIPDLHVVYARGPYAASGPVPDGVRTVQAFPLARYLPAFDVAIATAGYNTATELAHFGIPSVLLPLPRGIDDQRRRARHLAGLGFMTDCDSADVAAITAAAARMLAMGPQRAAVRGTGALAAARALVRSLETAVAPGP